MDNKIKPTTKILYILLSILLACVFWLYVRSADNPETKHTIGNIPVTFVGEDVLEANNLMVDSSTTSVRLEVQGKWSVVTRLRQDNITIQVDLSRVTSPGEHKLAYDILWPSGVSNNNVSVLDRNPFYVTVNVTRRVNRTVEVQGAFTGSVAGGHQAGEFSFQPSTIEISGEETEVAKVAYAKVTLNREEVQETVQEEMSFVLIGQDGEPVNTKNLTVSPATVSVTLPVVTVQETPLTVDLIPGGGADKDSGHVKIDIEPKSIILAGSEDDLAPYPSISLGSIDLAKVMAVDEIPFPIPIPPELDNVSGIQEATVSVSVEGLDTRTFTTENIEIVNDDRGIATPITQSLTVQIRGTPEALDAIVSQYIKVVVDLKGQSLPAGMNAVTPKVTLLGVNGAGVVGENYTVTINLSRSIQAD